jgi:hypothetical protein
VMVCPGRVAASVWDRASTVGAGTEAAERITSPGPSPARSADPPAPSAARWGWSRARRR